MGTGKNCGGCNKPSFSGNNAFIFIIIFILLAIILGGRFFY
jgi:hypothetical protein